MKGFTEGYNTMDALASLVFGIIVINTIRKMGVTSKRGILLATVKSGGIAILLLGIVYVGIAYLGATSTQLLGIFDSGGPVLSGTASHYFGSFGMILMAVIIFLACLTTSIGVTMACGEYFNSLFPKISYKFYIVIFSVFSLVVSNIGLSNIITYSIPVLMFIYPLAIVLMLLTFASPLFKHARLVYVAATIVTFLISSIDGLKTLCTSLGMDYFVWMKPIVSFYENTLPFYSQGLGWLVPVLIVMLVTGILVRVFNLSIAPVYKRVTS
jgi:LIVCS family branched-chain amino acid:cation transporter